MTDDLDFDHELRVAVQTAARGVLEPPGLTDRLISAATRPATRPQRRRIWTGPTMTRRLLPAFAVAAVVAVVAVVTTAVVAANADRHGPSTPPANSSSAAPTTSSAVATVAVPPLPLTTAPSVAGPSGPIGQAVPAGFVPYSVTFIDADHGWALGTTGCSTPQCVVIVRTVDGGRHWLRIPAPQLSVPSVLGPVAGLQLRFANALDGWAFDGRLFATHDGGASWARVAAITGAVIALGAGNGYVEAAVNSCPAAADCVATGTISVYRAPVGGDSWARVAASISQLTAGGGLTTPQFVVKGADWWLTAGGSLYHGSGSSAPARLAFPGGVIAVADAQHLDALTTGDAAAGTSQQQLWGTITGGQHWSTAGQPFFGPTQVDAIADSTDRVLLVAETSGASVLKRTSDDGGHFSTVLTLGDGGIEWYDLSFVTPQDAFVVLAGTRLYASHDAGAHWSVVNF